MTPTRCAGCGYELTDAFAAWAKNQRPSPGALTVCASCGVLMQFDETCQPLPIDDSEAFLRRVDSTTRAKVALIRAVIKHEHMFNPDWPKGKP